MWCGVCGVFGACVVWVFGGVWVWVLGRELGVQYVGDRKYRSPLYYPDTLVNPDTCLGNVYDFELNPVLL